MPAAPRLPSPGYTVAEFPSPNLADKVLTEVYDHTRSHFGPRNRYTEIPAYGTEHPDQPDFLLVHVKLEAPERMYKWYWVNDRLSEDDYNYSISYPEDDEDYPRIVRDYLVRRTEFASVDVDDHVADPTFATTFLTSQQLKRIDDPVLNSLYVNVEEVYEVIPGPLVLTTRYDRFLGAVNVTTQAVWAAGQTTTLTATAQTTYEARRGSVEVLNKVVETYSDGVSPTFPILVEDLWDKERGDIQRTSQLVVATGSEEGSHTASGAIITEVNYEPFNQFLLKKVIETGNGTYPTLTADVFDKERGPLQRTTQLVLAGGSEASTLVDLAGIITETTYEPYNHLLLRKVIETGNGTYPTFTADGYDPEKGAFEQTTQLMVTGVYAGSSTVSGGITVTEIKYIPYNHLLLRKEITTWTLPGPSLVQYLMDSETRSAVTVTTQMVVNPAGAYVQSPGSTIEYKPITDGYGLKVTTTLASYASVTHTVKEVVTMNLPRLITGVTAASISSLDGSVKSTLNWAGREATSAQVPSTVTVSYNDQATLTAAAPAVGYAPVLQSLVYDGLFFSANERGVLNDAITLGPLTTSSTNPKWGAVTEASVLWGASSPISATQYIALIGVSTTVLEVTIVPWKYNLYRMEVRRITLR